MKPGPTDQRILVINAGSSSVKYQLLAMPAGRRLANGLLEGIGTTGTCLHRSVDGKPSDPLPVTADDHSAAMAVVFDRLQADGLLDDLSDLCIGHRVVHGGTRFTAPQRIDQGLIDGLQAIAHLAPLHNAAGLAGIRAARERLTAVPQVAVFDTAFHHQLPATARHYALPLGLQRQLDIRRYGFHGMSHQFVAQTAADRLGRPLDTLKLITLHLGNGASACAIRNGHSVDTSMGFTPLEGLVMGSRCGDLDPALPDYIGDRLTLSRAEVQHLLNTESGLRGLCGDSDMRRIEQRMAAGDADAQLAFALFCYRIRKYVGAYVAVLNGVDALVFTAGIGEHSAAVRAAVCDQMDALGIRLDTQRNASAGDHLGTISPPDARVAVMVIPTDEERQIAAATLSCLGKGHDLLS